MSKVTNYLLVGLFVLLASLFIAQAYANNRLMSTYRQCLEVNNKYETIFTSQKARLSILKKQTAIIKEQIKDILSKERNFKTLANDSLAILITEMLKGGCNAVNSSVSGNTKSK